MVRRSSLVGLLAAAILSVGLASGEAENGVPEPHLVSNFDSGSLALIQERRGGTVECVPDDTGAGQCLSWTVAGSETVAWITIGRLPRDLRPFRLIRFRARFRGTLDGPIAVRLHSKTGHVGMRLPPLGPGWSRVELLVPEGETEGAFVPTDLRNVRLVASSKGGFTLEVDDLVLLARGDGWRYSPLELAAWGIDPAAPVYRIGNFDDEAHGGRFRADAGTAARVEEKNGKRSCALSWTAAGGDARAILALTRVPRDIREYAVLRFRARSNRAVRDGLAVRLRTLTASLERSVEGVSRKWRTFSIEIPSMLARDEFDPEAVTEVQFVHAGDKALALWLDDVELVKGPGGWHTTEEKQIATVFGEKRAGKVKRVETDHFVVFTDSAAARRKFPRALEDARTFVMEVLGLEDPGGHLAVYIFQNANLYHGFCVRKGRSREAAERSAGHADGAYFATYYQAPDAPTVVHELTHALFGRAVGRRGGSWFQEGVAVYVEERWQKRSAATLFAPLLRGGEFVPLAEFLRIPVLIAQDDATGGARTRDALYAQAGALFEFLIRGPYAPRVREALPVLASLDGAAEDLPDQVAKTLGMPLADLEKAWLAWGAHPPE